MMRQGAAAEPEAAQTREVDAGAWWNGQRRRTRSARVTLLQRWAKWSDLPEELHREGAAVASGMEDEEGEERGDEHAAGEDELSRKKSLIHGLRFAKRESAVVKAKLQETSKKVDVKARDAVEFGLKLVKLSRKPAEVHTYGPTTDESQGIGKPVTPREGSEDPERSFYVLNGLLARFGSNITDDAADPVEMRVAEVHGKAQNRYIVDVKDLGPECYVPLGESECDSESEPRTRALSMTQQSRLKLEELLMPEVQHELVANVYKPADATDLVAQQSEAMDQNIITSLKEETIHDQFDSSVEASDLNNDLMAEFLAEVHGAGLESGDTPDLCASELEVTDLSCGNELVAGTAQFLPTLEHQVTSGCTKDIAVICSVDVNYDTVPLSARTASDSQSEDFATPRGTEPLELDFEHTDGGLLNGASSLTAPTESADALKSVEQSLSSDLVKQESTFQKVSVPLMARQFEEAAASRKADVAKLVKSGASKRDTSVILISTGILELVQRFAPSSS